jgi:hypothetical protein
MTVDGEKMKWLLLSFGILLSLALTGCTVLAKDDNTESYYKYNQEFPLQVGNSWVYQVTRSEGFNPNDIMTATFTTTDTVTDIEIKNGFFVATFQSEHTAETLVEVHGTYPTADSLKPATTVSYWLIVDGNRILRQDDNLNLSDLQSQVLVQFVFPISLNSQWSMNNANDAPPNQKVTKVGSITVPAGTFDECFYREGSLGGMTFEDWFCPGIGVVWSNAEHHGTPYGTKRELVSYKVK